MSNKIVFTLEDIGDEVGLSIELPEGLDPDCKLVHAAAAMFSMIKLKDNDSILDNFEGGTLQ